MSFLSDSYDLAADGGVLSVDLAALAENWRRLSARLKSSVDCGAVVKADAYGLGVEPVAMALYGAGCRSFYVAVLSEGIALHKSLAALGAGAVESVRIYVLDGLRPGTEPLCVQHGLIPVVFTRRQLERWVGINRDLLAGGQSPAACAVKFDTGMTRLGFDVDELRGLEQLLSEANPVLFLSHLACAEQADHPLTALQLERFQAERVWLQDRFPAAAFSLCNSSGIYLGTEYHFDAVRPGAALYGVNPTPDLESPVRPVVRLRLPIVQLRDARAGETVGYGGTYQLGEDARLAVVLGGYADGLPRALSNRAHGFVAGVEVPVVGRVSMDSMVFDVSAVELPLVEGESYIEMLGERSTVDDLAASAGTIGYELLTSFGKRYQREYLQAE